MSVKKPLEDSSLHLRTSTRSMLIQLPFVVPMAARCSETVSRVREIAGIFSPEPRMTKLRLGVGRTRQLVAIAALERYAGVELGRGRMGEAARARSPPTVGAWPAERSPLLERRNKNAGRVGGGHDAPPVSRPRSTLLLSRRSFRRSTREADQRAPAGAPHSPARNCNPTRATLPTPSRPPRLRRRFRDEATG
jgi:hypothetical protein